MSKNILNGLYLSTTLPHINDQNNDGDIASHLAARAGLFTYFRDLFELGAYLDIPNKAGVTARHELNQYDIDEPSRDDTREKHVRYDYYIKLVEDIIE